MLNESAATTSKPLESLRDRARWSWAQGLSVLIPIWYLLLGLAFEQHLAYIPYFITEWMISYSGGFVRRGLPGQLLLSGDNLFHCGPLELLKYFRWSLALFFLVVLGYGVYRNARFLGLAGTLAILLSPLVAVCTWTDLGAIDLLFTLIGVLNVVLATRLSPETYFKAAMIWIGIFGVVIGLSHEGFLLLSLPLNLAISARKLGLKNWPKWLAIYAAPIAACLIAAKFNGSPHQAELITDAWSEHGVNIPANSSILYLGRSVRDEMRFMGIYFTWENVLKCGAALAICVSPLVLLFKSLPVEAQLKKRILIEYFVIPLVSTIPLYFIGSDWHRWVMIPFTSGVMCLLYTNYLEAGLNLSRRQTAIWTAFILLVSCVVPAAPYYDVASILKGSTVTSANILRNLLLRGTTGV